jgi:predicted ArsR family transcriptional regulator
VSPVPAEHESPRRRAVLDQLRTAGRPLSVNEVAEHLDVHPNTVRFHLDALVADGRIERSIAQPAGPGRPRTVYAPPRGMDRRGARGYQLLARMLLSNLAAQGSEARTTATETGRAWGRFLIETPAPYQHPSPAESAARLTALLEELDFAPTPQDPGPDGIPARLRLGHCPFLELAEEYGQLVCPLHLGLMQGALAELGAPISATRVEPFAQPDACLAYLAPG